MLWVSGFETPTPSLVQAAAATQSVPDGALKVVLTCAACDSAALRTSLPFVEFVTDAATADVDVAVTPAAGTSDARATIKVTGHGRFAGRNRQVTYRPAPSLPPDQARAEFVRFLKLSLAEYVALTPPGQ